MANVIEVKVPDIGNAKDVEVIEVMVKPGAVINKDDSIITLESEKSSMEIPAPESGVVKEIKLKVGDKVSEGHLILTLEAQEAAAVEEKKAEPAPAAVAAPVATKAAAPSKLSDLAAKLEPTKPAAVPASAPAPALATGKAEIKEVVVPDIGNAKDVEIIEVMVKVGDSVAEDQSIVTLEGEKATMEIPSPFTGVVKEINVTVGKRVNKNDLLMRVETQTGAAVSAPVAAAPTQATEVASAAPTSSPAPTKPVAAVETSIISETSSEVHAGPAVRRMARELGVNLTLVRGSGPKNRIVTEDLQNYVKAQLAQAKAAPAASGFAFPEMPKVDFTKFGDVETKPLSRIKKISGQNLHRNWVGIPHITQFDEADITEMEAFRVAAKAEADANGVKLTPLVFLMKAVVAALKKYPAFNSSLDSTGENLFVKKYYHVGVAVDTPNGLVVPVIRNVDQKGMFELAKELAAISTKARDKGLALADMQGGCFTISSLGGIGGTAFTPIINAPEVAILGVSKSSMKPVYKDGTFVPRLMLPLSLSYDHRVIDGAEAARFIVYLAQQLTDIRRLLL